MFFKTLFVCCLICIFSGCVAEPRDKDTKLDSGDNSTNDKQIEDEQNSNNSSDQSNVKFEIHKTHKPFQETEWKVAKSAKGHFSIHMPGNFDDTTTSGNSDRGKPGSLHLMVHVAAGGVKFSVTEIEGGNPVPAEEFVNEVVKKWTALGDLVGNRQVNQLGSKSTELILENGNTRLIARVMVIGDFKYILMIENPNKSSKVNPKTIARFFASFESPVMDK